MPDELGPNGEGYSLDMFTDGEFVTKADLQLLTDKLNVIMEMNFATLTQNVEMYHSQMTDQVVGAIGNHAILINSLKIQCDATLGIVKIYEGMLNQQLEINRANRMVLRELANKLGLRGLVPSDEDIKKLAEVMRKNNLDNAKNP